MPEQQGCWNYCAGRLEGIAENQRRLGKISDDFEVEVVPMNKHGLYRTPKHSFIATCEHGRRFIVRPKKKT